MTIIRGSVAVLGYPLTDAPVSADAVLPARYSFLQPEQMAERVLDELGLGVNARVRAHPILIVGTAFGYGTGRESPARGLRAAGVRALVGLSFSRMFFRNAVNNGVLALECPALIRAGIAEDDLLEIDLQQSEVRWRGREFAVAALPPLILGVLAAGGLIAYGRCELAGGGNT